MAQSAMMSGPDGTDVRCYRRSARQIKAGDYLPEYGAAAVADVATDDETGRHYVALATDEVVELTPRGKAWIFRTYDAPAWMSDAVSAYRDARDARDVLRESGAVVPTSVPGAAGSAVAYYQLEDSDFDAAVPRPRLADFIRDAAAMARTGMVPA